MSVPQSRLCSEPLSACKWLEAAHHRALSGVQNQGTRHVNTTSARRDGEEEEEIRGTRRGGRKEKETGRGEREVSNDEVPFTRVIKILNTWS